MRDNKNRCPPDGWAVVSEPGRIYCHPARLAEPERWFYVFAHCLLHLGLGHFPIRENGAAWNAACDYCVAKLLKDLKIGSPPEGMDDFEDLGGISEEKLYELIGQRGTPKGFERLGTAGASPDMAEAFPGEPRNFQGHLSASSGSGWQALLAEGIGLAVKGAISAAAGFEALPSGDPVRLSPAKRTREWFINSYPLLGALAVSFEIVEDLEACQRASVTVAAIDTVLKEIYVNPAARLSEEERKFVLAHEFLHAGLRHDARAEGRDPFLWNVACDYVINDWLLQMEIGEPPPFGLLHDPELRGLSAESVYDRICADLRKLGKLATLRGVGLGDIFRPPERSWWKRGDGIGLDEFYREALAQGLSYHLEKGRGYLPEGLVEEIRALSHPPIAWDVELSRWFDGHFAPLERRRTYSRLSRRQAASPGIPRPGWHRPDTAQEARTFGVLLDTSGSMDRRLLATALGAIASYSVSRDVPAVRLVFCDAAAYDQGYVRPEDVMRTVKVRGRGGTVLQPGLDLLRCAEDFPKDAPVLIITDGQCDVLRPGSREHAILVPIGARLPFAPRGKVFRINSVQ